MKIKRTSFFICLMVSFFTIFVNVCAVFPNNLTSIKESGNKGVDSEEFGTYVKRSSNGYSTFCTMYYQNTPAGNGITCTLNGDWSLPVRAGVASIISSSGLSKDIKNAKNTNYLKAELTINRFLYEKDSKLKSRYLGIYTTTSDKWYNKAVDTYDSVKDAIKNISISIGSLSESNDESYYYLNGSVTKKYADDYSIESNMGTVKKSGSKFTVSIPQSSLKEGSNTITITATATKSEKIARNYSCGNNYQTLTPIYVENSVVATSKKVSKKHTITINSTGNIKITKTDKDSGKPIQGIEFYLDKDKTKKCTSDSSGKCEIKNIPFGTYKVVEDSDTAKTKGYSGNYSESVTINSSKKNISLSVTNQKDCASEFELYKNDKQERIRMYKDYSSKGFDYTNLLDFNNTTDASKACSTATNCNSSNNITMGCLSAKNNSTFSANNLSCYNETITVGSYTGYCRVTFNLTNTLVGFNDTHLSGTKYSFGSGFIPGQMVLNRTNENSIIATGKIIKTCYVYGTGIASSPTKEENKNYSDYIKDLSLNNEKLPTANNTDSGWKKNDISGGASFTKTLSDSYRLKPVYSDLGTGLTSNQQCSSKTNACRLLGYGFKSNLDAKSGQTIDVPFSINININKTTVGSSTNKCSYKIDSSGDRIVCDPSKQKCGPDDSDPGTLNLEFRLIDTSNPFPGKSGNGRKVGSNWCESNQYSYTIADALNALQIANGSITPTSTELDKYDLNRDGIIDLEEALNIQSIATSEISMLCTNDNSTIQEYIKNAPNSYGRVPNTNATATPIYKIELTPDTIKSIRDYNKDKETTYDDYTLKCDYDGVNCKSTFLEMYGIKRLSKKN